MYIKEDRKEVGEPYYRYLLADVDDVLSIGINLEDPLKIIGQLFKTKSGSLGRPARYLGAGIDLLQKEDGSTMWASNCTEH